MAELDPNVRRKLEAYLDAEELRAMRRKVPRKERRRTIAALERKLVKRLRDLAAPGEPRPAHWKTVLVEVAGPDAALPAWRRWLKRTPKAAAWAVVLPGVAWAIFLALKVLGSATALLGIALCVLGLIAGIAFRRQRVAQVGMALSGVSLAVFVWWLLP